jgi:hypothetical protein
MKVSKLSLVCKVINKILSEVIYVFLLGKVERIEPSNQSNTLVQ